MRLNPRPVAILNAVILFARAEIGKLRVEEKTALLIASDCGIESALSENADHTQKLQHQKSYRAIMTW